MKVAVLGGGNGAHAIAADLSLGGIAVKMWEHPKFSEKFQRTLQSGKIEIEGVARQGIAELAEVTMDLKKAIKGVDLIMVVMPAFGHEEIARLCAPLVEESQTIILIPGNAGSFVFMKTFKELNVKKNLTLCETSTLPYATRLIGSAHVKVLIKARIVPLGVFPAKETNKVVEKFKSLYPETIAARNVIEAAINNPNPIVHSAGSLLNAGRIEYSSGEFYFYKEGLTKAVGNLIVAMDEERIAISKALGVRIYSTEETSSDSFLNTSMDVLFGSGSPPRLELEPAGKQRSPSNLEDRFITEDVPFGLVFMASLGKMIGVHVPVMEAVIRLFSTINKSDYWKMGRNMERLGISNLSKEALIKLLEKGGHHDRL